MITTTRACRLHGKQDLRIDVLPVGQPEPDQVLVRVGAGGICGSDMHYYSEGGFGPIRVREPIVLGHEFSGSIESVGENITGLAAGDKVAINPSQPCGQCAYCEQELFHHCLEMRFIGSAMRFPHEQGGFRDFLLVNKKQCVKVNADTDLSELACSEPLSVAIHAVKQAGDMQGKRVLVTGAGPIGCLCIAAAIHAGATEIVATDLYAATLNAATKMGAARVINVNSEAEALEEYTADKGYFDVVFECSAAPQAIQTALDTLKPRATLVQVGVSGNVSIPLNLLVAKEINYVGSHRFHEEFAIAAKLIESGEIDVSPIITKTLSMTEATQAFALASDRTQAVKVQLSFA